MTGHTEAARAYRRLREMIIRAELAPGAPLHEADLMVTLGVGRTPLRDALHRLAHEGLVEIMPRRGTFVSEVTIADLQQIFEVAWPFEEVVARLAAERCTPNDLAELRRLLEMQAKVPPERGATNEIDGELYRLLLRIAGNRYLADVYQRVGTRRFACGTSPAAGATPTPSSGASWRRSPTRSLPAMRRA